MSEQPDTALDTSPTEDDVTVDASQQSVSNQAAETPSKRGDIGGLLVGFVVAAALLNALVGVAYWVGDSAKVAQETAIRENVLTHVNPQQAQLVAEDRAAIANFAVVDANTDQYKVPVTHAMHLLATNAVPQPPPAENDKEEEEEEEEEESEQ